MSRKSRCSTLVLTVFAMLVFVPAAFAQVTTFTFDSGPQTENRTTDCQHQCTEACKSGCNHVCDTFCDVTACPQSCSECAGKWNHSVANLESIGVIADDVKSAFNSEATGDSSFCSSANCCDGSRCKDCNFCCSDQALIEKSEFCCQVAELLRVALKNKNLDDPSSREVIESALALVAKNAQTEANTQIAELKIEHEKEMASMRGQAVQMSTQHNNAENLKNWLGPLYTNQNRAIQQIQMLAYSSNAINRTLTLLEKQMSTKNSGGSTQASNANPYLKRDEHDSEVYDLKRQVNELKKQIQQIQPQRVQPANHLQPIFDSKQTKPLDISWPTEGPWNQQQNRR